ncbi:retrovirus-related pol polyprotein from transposon TNT 1-94 [Tanacetum coccineum]
MTHGSPFSFNLSKFSPSLHAVATALAQNDNGSLEAESIAKSVNPLALLAAAQPYSDNYYQAPKPQRSNVTSSSTRPSASTRHKGKEIAKPVTPQSESVSEEDSDPEQAQRDKEMQKNLALLAKNKTEDTTPRYNNDNQSGQFGNQRTMTVAGARETVGSPVVQQNGIQCFNCKGFGHYAKGMQGSQSVLKDYRITRKDDDRTTDEEIDEQELEAHYSFMAKIQEVLPGESSSTEQPLEQVQNHDEDNVFANERRHSEQPESINDTIVLEKDDSNVTLIQQNIFKGKAKRIIDQEVEEGKTTLMRLIGSGGGLRREEIDKMIEMDKQLKFLNEIIYTRNQSIQTIHMLAPKCSTYNGRPTFANPRYLKKAQSEKPCLYEIPYDTSDLAKGFAIIGRGLMTLANESRSKLNKDYVKPYDYTRQNSLYEIFKAPSLEYLYQLERAKEVRKTMWRKPFVRTKPNIAKNVAFLPVSKSISKSRQVFNDMTFNINQFREIVDQAWFKHTSDYFRVPTAKDMEVLIKTLLMPLSIKTQNDSFRFEHELKTEMHEDYEYVKSLEKEVDELESEKADFSNIYDLLLEECVSKDVTCSYLHSLSDLNAYAELQCLYLHKVKECECLAQKFSKQTEFVNKEVHNKLLKSFAKLENHSISLELALQQCKEQMKNNSVCKENGSNVFRKEREQYHEIQEGKSVETQFDKPFVVRQPNAQRIPKPSVLRKPTPFSNSPKMRSFQMKQSVNKTNVSDGLFKQVTQQNLPQNRKQAEIHSNVLKPGMYRIATTTTQNREPQLPHASRNTNPHVLNLHETSNVNAVCAECGKCVFNSNHDACVSRYLNDVNARTKKPNVEWKWWIAKTCPSGYTWTQKPLRTKKIWMPKIRKDDVSTSISPTIDIVSRITNIVQLILFIVDSGCTKHMTGNLKLLCNFVEKFLGTVRFGNDQFAPILGYGDLNQGNVMIKQVYYVEGLNHNLFSVGQFCDADLEVAFRKSTCFVRDLQGNDLLTGNRGSDLYTISLQETTSSTPICFMAKASPTQAWLWHRRLSHLNFDYITLLSKKDIVTGLPKLKYVKDQLCSSCEMSKAKRSSFKSKVVPSSKGRLNLLHMDLCGPMRVASINGKKYILECR